MKKKKHAARYGYLHLYGHVHTRRLKKKYRVAPEDRWPYSVTTIIDNAVTVDRSGAVLQELEKISKLLKLILGVGL